MPKLAITYKFKFPGLIYFVTGFLVVLLVSVYLVYEFHKQLKITAKQQFIGTASANLVSANQAIGELALSLNYADANYEKVTNIEGQRANYDIVISDNQKSLSQIQSLSKSFDFQKNSINELNTPKDYTNLKSEFLGFYENSQELLSKLQKNLEFENKILKTLSANKSYQINIQSSLWQENNSQAIIDSYQSLTDEAARAVANLTSLKPSKKYEDYYNLQISYFNLIASKAQDVVNNLKAQPRNTDPLDDATNLEIAYKIALDLKAEVDQLQKQLDQKRSAYLSIDADEEEFEVLLSSKNKLEAQIKDVYQDLYLESTKGFKNPF